jgi:hypothetical protein
MANYRDSFTFLLLRHALKVRSLAMVDIKVVKREHTFLSCLSTGTDRRVIILHKDNDSAFYDGKFSEFLKK